MFYFYFIFFKCWAQFLLFAQLWHKASRADSDRSKDDVVFVGARRACVLIDRVPALGECGPFDDRNNKLKSSPFIPSEPKYVLKIFIKFF